MRYAIVATTGWLLLVDLQTKKVQALENSRPEYYGISWFEGDNDLVLSHTGLDSATLTDINAYALSERGWVSKGGLRSRNFLSAPHQILCAPDNRIVCANTGRNVISVFDYGRPNVYQEAGISSERWDRLSLENLKGDHLNSVFLRDDRLYVIAHGFSKGSKLAVFSYPGLEIISVEAVVGKTGLHNIWIKSNGQRISCHSEGGSLIDLHDKYPLWESGSDGYTRGLAATDEYVLVGESQKSGRDLRRSSLSGLWILDAKTWKPLDYLSLGPYGVVMEVRVLDAPDDAHHGKPFKGLAALLTKDALMEISHSRLSGSRAVAENARLWATYEPVFGAPAISNDGFKCAAVDQLSLAIKNENSPTQIKFEYSLDNDSKAHISAVLGYQGNGGDSTVSAVLLRPVDAKAVLSVWRNDGQTWSLLPIPNVFTHLPLSGTMTVAVTEKQATVQFSDGTSMVLSNEQLCLDRCNYGLGIRWAGGSVRPVESVSS